MDSANRTDMEDIGSVSMVNRGTRASAMVLDFDQSVVVAQVEDVVKLVAMGHFVVEVSLVEVAAASIVTSEFVDTFYSTDY